MSSEILHKKGGNFLYSSCLKPKVPFHGGVFVGKNCGSPQASVFARKRIVTRSSATHGIARKSRSFSAFYRSPKSQKRGDERSVIPHVRSLSIIHIPAPLVSPHPRLQFPTPFVNTMKPLAVLCCRQWFSAVSSVFNCTIERRKREYYTALKRWSAWQCLIFREGNPTLGLSSSGQQ